MGVTAPGGGGGNGPFCCAPRVTANKQLAIRSSGPAFMALLAGPAASKVSPSISSSLLRFLFIVIHLRIRCIDLHFRGLHSFFSVRSGSAGKETIDVSPSGVLVKARRILPPGSAVGVRLHLSGRIRPVVATGWSSAFWMEIKWGFILTAWLSPRANDCRSSSCLWSSKRVPEPLQPHCSNSKSPDCTTSPEASPYRGAPSGYERARGAGIQTKNR